MTSETNPTTTPVEATQAILWPVPEAGRTVSMDILPKQPAGIPFEMGQVNVATLEGINSGHACVGATTLQQLVDQGANGHGETIQLF